MSIVRSSSVRLLALGFAVAGALFVGTWALVRPMRLVAPEDSRRLSIPSLVDLGALYNDSVKVVKVEIANQGRSAVTLDDFRASCSCMSVYLRDSSAKVAVGKLVLSPGASSTVLVDIRVAGDPGSAQAVFLWFRDVETRYTYSVPIAYKPVASLYAVPKSVFFGDVPIGERVTQRVELRSSTRSEKVPVKAVVPEARSVTARIGAASVAQTEQFESANPGQHLVGYLDVTLEAGTGAASVRETVLISKAGTARAEIPVSAEIVTGHTLIPSRVILPRRSSAGLLYSARIICLSRFSDDFKVKLGLVTGPLRAVVEQPSEAQPDRAFVRVEYVGDLPGDAARDYELGLKVVQSGREYDLRCPIRVLGAAP